MNLPLDLLQHWYQLHCNGEWEHQHGVLIETLDNPGWRVAIDLKGTSLYTKRLDMERSTSEESWISIHVSEGKFEGHGGVGELSEIIETFLSWAGYPCHTSDSS